MSVPDERALLLDDRRERPVQRLRREGDLRHGFARLLLRLREAEVEVEVAGRGRDPRDAPTHAALVPLKLLERCLRDEEQRRVTGVQVRDDAVDRVGDRRVDRATGLVARAEHEVVDEQLGPPVEQLGERLLPVVRLEAVVLLHPHPGQIPTQLRDLVAQPGVLLLPLEQFLARREPLLARSDRVTGHSSLPPCRPARFDTAATANWALSAAHFATAAVSVRRRMRARGVRLGWSGDERPDRQGARRGRRGVPGADRAVPSGAPGALLPDARIPPGRRGRPPGDADGRLARPRRVRGTGLDPHVAVPDRHQPVPQRASFGQPAPGQGVGHRRVSTS